MTQLTMRDRTALFVIEKVFEALAWLITTVTRVTAMRPRRQRQQVS
jgi:hypothetical protein